MMQSSWDGCGTRVDQLLRLPSMQKYLAGFHREAQLDLQLRGDCSHGKPLRSASLFDFSGARRPRVVVELAAPATPPALFRLPTYEEYKRLTQSQQELDTSGGLGGCGDRGLRHNLSDTRDLQRRRFGGGCGGGGDEMLRTLAELVDTEERYGRDLRLMLTEFHGPLLAARLLTPEETAAIFLNLPNLHRAHETFLVRLKAGDSDYDAVGRVADAFLDGEEPLGSLQRYSAGHRRSLTKLEQLERRCALLRHFLRASQSDNLRLRRMPLRAFMIAPVQRLMRYPMLLDRLLRRCPAGSACERLRRAKTRVEAAIAEADARAAEPQLLQPPPAPPAQQAPLQASSRFRIFGSSSNTSLKVIAPAASTIPSTEVVRRQRSASCSGPVDLVRVALDRLRWDDSLSRPRIGCLFNGLVEVAETSVGGDFQGGCCGVVLARDFLEDLKDNDNALAVQQLLFPGTLNRIAEVLNSQTMEAALVLFREQRLGVRALFREPMLLSSCVVSAANDFADIRILEVRGGGGGGGVSGSFVCLRASGGPAATRRLLWLLRRLSVRCGRWRLRRPALGHALLYLAAPGDEEEEESNSRPASGIASVTTSSRAASVVSLIEGCETAN